MGVLLAKFGLSAPIFWGTLALSVFLAGAASLATWRITSWSDQTEITAAQHKQDRAEKALSDYHATIEANRADANLKAFDDLVRLSKQADALRAELAGARSAAVSANLRKGLNNAPPSDVRTLSPAVRRYLNGVPNPTDDGGFKATGDSGAERLSGNPRRLPALPSSPGSP